MSANWPNEPSGTVLFDWTFSQVEGVGPINSAAGTMVANIGLDDATNDGLLATDATAPLSPSTVMRAYMFPASFSGGIQLDTIGLLTFNASDIYVGFWWKRDYADGTLNGFNKMTYLKTNDAPAYFYGYSTTPGQSVQPWEFRLDLQVNNPAITNNHIASTVGAQRNIFTTGYTLTSNVWYRIEYRVRLSTTATSRNGWLQGWITPFGGSTTQIWNLTNINWGPSTNTFYNHQITETWDGANTAGWIRTQTVAHIFDHYHLSLPSGVSDTTPPAAPTGVTVT